MRFFLPHVFASLALWTKSCRPCEFPEGEAAKLRTERFGEHGHFLRNADRLEIYALASTGNSKMPAQKPTDQTFHGFQVFGAIKTSNNTEVERVWSDLHDRIHSNHSHIIVYCFWPRHGIRAYQGHISRDYLICFECAKLRVYQDPQSEQFTEISLEHSVDVSALHMDKLLDTARIPREHRPKSSLHSRKTW